ncbi:hypothetical protein [Dyella choica]|uniref:DUF2946 domain-containing protein n=1 Tax=Dyella choica TaxID=1927959 RepID=A0A3S0S7F8_9GAMM|nr:hypothetical protein [Dyella choica]RUL70881.1 hypothetical protein EKH80_19835 [Dyella choica]
MRMRLRRRHRRVLWIGMALFCLLFQQVAMAGYVCNLETQRSAALTGTCAEMAANQHGYAHAHADPRCTEHCAPSQAAQSADHAPTVPPLILSALSLPSSGAMAIAPKQACLDDPLQHRLEPPPMLRFCTLLI